MKHPVIKLIIAVLLTLILFSVMLFGFITIGEVFGVHERMESASVKLDGITMNISNMLATYNKLVNSYSEQLATNAALFSVALSDEVRTLGDASIRAYDNACVVKKQGSTIVLPEDGEDIPPMVAVPYTGSAPIGVEDKPVFSGDGGLFWTRRETDPEDSFLLCTYYRLYGDYFYVSYIPDSEIVEYFNSRINVNKLMDATQEVYGGLIVGIQTTDERLPVFRVPDELQQYQYAADMGITLNNVDTDEYQAITIDGKRYEYAISDPLVVDGDAMPIRIIFLVPQASFVRKNVEGNVVLGEICMGMMMVVIIWMISIIRTIRRGSITETQRQQYSAGRVRAMMLCIGAVCTVLVFLANMFIGALASMYYRSEDCENALETMEQMIEDNHNNQKNIVQQRETLYLGYATRIAELLSDYPQLRTANKLGEMSGIIDADYIMLYDEDGNETLTDSRYVNLSFGKQASSSTYDFRRLLSGVPGIVHEACVDEQTGLNRQLIGVSMDGDGAQNGYEALVIALKPTDEGNILTDDEIMDDLTTRDSIAFSVDRTSGKILHSSEDDDVGANAVDLGLSDSNLRSAMLDFFTLDNASWYGRSREFGGAIHYYAYTVENMFGDSVLSSLLHAGLFLLFYLVIAFVLLLGYTEKNIDRYCSNVMKDGAWLYQRMEELRKTLRLRKAWDRLSNWWKNKTPGAKALWVAELQLGCNLLVLFGNVLMNNSNGGDMAIISFILGGRWTPGLNLFALTKIVLLILGTILLTLVIKALVGLLSGTMHAKSKTIFHLIGNLICYMVVIAVIYIVCKTLGFDTTTIIASVGSLSLAISMASKDIIADVLAGILLVFGDEYQIGEIVEIGGFRGWVANIGIRSTTLVNDEGNIKNINNRNVSNVVNLSRRNSVVAVQAAIDYNTSLDAVEEMLRRELPALGETIPNIVSGPTYLGVTGMDRGSLKLTVSAECREEDRETVGSALMAELKRMFDRNQIPMRDR